MSYHTFKTIGFIVLGLILLSITTGCGEAGGNELATNQKSLPSVQTKNWKDLSASKTEQYSTTPFVRSTSGGNLIWAKDVRGEKSNQGNAITTLSDNSTVVTGWFGGSATFGEGEPNQTVLTSTGNVNIFVVRYNPDGTLAWAKRAGGTHKAGGEGITNLSDNSTIVTGYFWRTATFGEGEPNKTVLNAVSPLVKSERFLARYNPDGTLAWAKRTGESGNAFCKHGITSLSDNSIIMAGWLLESAIFGEDKNNQTVLTSTGGSDIFIARYGPDGTFIWAKRAGSSGDHDYASGITTLSDDSTVVTGHFSSSATFGEDEPNQTVLTSDEKGESFIARYNPDGTLRWAKSAGFSGANAGVGITTLSDNSTVVTGFYSYPSVTFGMGQRNETVLKHAGEQDLFIARYSQDGTFVWAKRIGGIFKDEVYGITSLSDDSTVVTGVLEGFATFGEGESKQTVLSSAGKKDFFIARYNSDGTLAWAKRGGGKGTKQFNSDGSMASWDESDLGSGGNKNSDFAHSNGITALSDNSTVVTGYFAGSAIFGEGESNRTIMTASGDSAAFIARFAP